MQLEEHPFFHASQAEDIRPLAERTAVDEYRKDDVIFKEGSPSDTLCLVLEGTVAFTKTIPGEEDRIISYSEAGNFFGEVGIFTGAPRALNAVAKTTPVRIAQIHRESLVEFIKSTPGPIEQILGSIVNHLHATTRHYVDDMLQKEKMAMVGTMMNTIIHDFKNPFTLISLGAQLLRTQHPDPKTIRLCENIEAQVERMVEMANELSEFSKGEQRLHLTRIDLAELCEKFRQMNEPFFQHDRVVIEMRATPVTIMGEESKLIRVLQNLVGNAIEAFDEKERGQVQIYVHKYEDRAEIVVSDNGKGIPESIRHNLFSPFITYGKSRGTGLGTAIVKSIVDAHGGSIDFETATGAGTTFTITLPLAPQAE
ncbi:MAG: ATP-binding protein [Verrucomicrobiota bacterium JB024]|nr:ATP-binding protein [Verrucomicrobiota bacterium JB024]